MTFIMCLNNEENQASYGRKYKMQMSNCKSLHSERKLSETAK